MVAPGEHHMRYDHITLLPERAFRRRGGYMTLEGGKGAEAPNYKPLAEASSEAAKLMYDLGQDQLGFAKQQYEDLSPLLESISNQQMDIADQTADQGQDYYDYQKSFRPVEGQMLDDAMQGRQGEIDAYDASNRADAASLTQDPTGLYNAHRGEIDAQVGRAVADSQGAYTRDVNQAIRQGLRYGSGMGGIIANVANIGMAHAQQQAAAANATREAGIQDVRGRIATGLQLRQNNMGAKNAQEAIDWAKKLDAAGLVKGMAGASQGAYGLAISAGNAAGQNAMAPGNQYMAGMAQGANTIGQGQQMKINGLSNVLSAQTQMAASDDSGSTGGAIIGAVGTMAAAY